MAGLCQTSVNRLASGSFSGWNPLQGMATQYTLHLQQYKEVAVMPSVPPSASSPISAARPSAGTPDTAASGGDRARTWIVLGDLHDKAARLGDIRGLEEADGIIVTGDLTVTGGVAQARKVLEKLARYNSVIYAQIGNMDRGEITEWLAEQGWNTHLCVRELAPGVAIMGLGCSTFTPFGTPSEFPESRFADWLEHMWRDARKYRHVVLSSHTPPHDTLCDIVGDGIHVGSSAVRDFLLDAQPDVCLCGHIHESRALDRLGRTVLVNPGAFATGGYAVLRLAGDDLSVTLHMLD